MSVMLVFVFSFSFFMESHNKVADSIIFLAVMNM